MPGRGSAFWHPTGDLSRYRSCPKTGITLGSPCLPHPPWKRAETKPLSEGEPEGLRRLSLRGLNSVP